jgi:carbon starvation protein
MDTLNDRPAWQTKALWVGIALLGAVSFGIVALNRGEAVNAAWLVVAAVCVYFIAYRFYGLFVANRALGVDATRPTPASRHNDGLDYVPTNRYVLFGHHFAAIAGAGPLVGPVLAAQMGYLPGTLWILAGAVFAGAIQDMTVLFCRHGAMVVRSAISFVPRWDPLRARLPA